MPLQLCVAANLLAAAALASAAALALPGDGHSAGTQPYSAAGTQPVRSGHAAGTRRVLGGYSAGTPPYLPLVEASGIRPFVGWNRTLTSAVRSSRGWELQVCPLRALPRVRSQTARCVS